MRLIANTRMYEVDVRTRHLWRGLIVQVSRSSGVPLDVVEHSPPAPMDDLWKRHDMGLVQMCGWPFWRSDPRPNLVATPVLDHEYCKGRPVYWTNMVVRHDDPAIGLEGLFGRRFGWTIESSHSGYNAPRRLLLPHYLEVGRPLFSQSLGPFKSPMGIVRAVIENEIDVGPVDGYFHLLLARHRPKLAARLRTIAVTDVAPMPPFVASGRISDDELGRLRESAAHAHLVPAARKIMENLAIERFVLPEIGFYETAEDWCREAIENGYRKPV